MCSNTQHEHDFYQIFRLYKYFFRFLTFFSLRSRVASMQEHNAFIHKILSSYA